MLLEGTREDIEGYVKSFDGQRVAAAMRYFLRLVSSKSALLPLVAEVDTVVEQLVAREFPYQVVRTLHSDPAQGEP